VIQKLNTRSRAIRVVDPAVLMHSGFGLRPRFAARFPPGASSRQFCCVEGALPFHLTV